LRATTRWTRTILLDVAFNETNPDHRAFARRDAYQRDEGRGGCRSAKAPPQGTPFEPGLARPVRIVSSPR